MTRAELIRNVALKMDEISSSDDVIVSVLSSDNNPLYTQINGLLNESVNDVLTKAPVHRLQSHVALVQNNVQITLSLFGGLRMAAIIDVPSDFIRLVSIFDHSFQRPIVELAMEGDDTDKRQHNRHLVAKGAKPVAVMSVRNGKRQIICYSYDVDATAKPSLFYIKRYEGGDLSAETGLDEYLTDLVSWVCAGRVFAAQGDVTKGKICDENASALMI